MLPLMKLISDTTSQYLDIYDDPPFNLDYINFKGRSVYLHQASQPQLPNYFLPSLPFPLSIKKDPYPPPPSSSAAEPRNFTFHPSKSPFNPGLHHAGHHTSTLDRRVHLSTGHTPQPDRVGVVSTFLLTLVFRVAL